MEEFFRLHGSTVVVAASTFVAMQLLTNLFRRGPSAISPTKVDHKVRHCDLIAICHGRCVIISLPLMHL
jgi:hypothetical protein